MGKDKTAKINSGKTKPSGINKEEAMGLDPAPLENIKPYNENTGKYTQSEDELLPDVYLRHPNRNNNKGEDPFKSKMNNPQSDKIIGTTILNGNAKTLAEELPGKLTKELFKELAIYKSPCCISIFLSIHNAGEDINKKFDPISFKNALQEATALLKKKNVATAEIEIMLEAGYDLLRNDSFWSEQLSGLAIFIAKNYFKYIKMPVAPAPDIIAEDTFYVTPLIPLMVGNEYFYLLVISKKQTKLFKGDAFGMEYIPVENVPAGLAEELGDTDVATTFRAGGSGATDGGNYHGIGGGNNNDDKTYIANYLESVDDVIWKKVLHNENAPLLLAGVDYLIPIYRSVSDYKYLYEDALTGSHEHEDTASLYKQARQKMEPYFLQRVNKAIENYANQSATQLTSSFINYVVPAAYYARVSHLFVQKGAHVWGTFDEMENRLQLTNKEIEGAQDLVDNAVVKTLLNGGEVYLLDKDKMPAEGELAAIFRY